MFLFSFPLTFLPSNPKGDAPFYHKPHDYSHDDWDDIHDHLRDVPWENVFKLGIFSAATEFRGWVHVEIDVYIPHRKYQVTPESSPWFSAASTATIA